jgi:CO/xanthine dehydrogenase FAD-binding subunit
MARADVDGRFISPTALPDALAALAAGHRPVAGGTDLVVGTRQGKWLLPVDLVALNRIPELRGIDETAGGLRIGATSSHADLARHPAIRERWTAIADAASIVGSPATRHIGTLGGNLANASPAAETSGPLLCFEAQVEVRSTAGSRLIALADLISAPGKTTVHSDELIVAVELPELVGAGSCYVRLEFRRQMEIAVVGATAVVRLDGGVVQEARIAITALAPTVRRIATAESALVGTDGGPAAAAEAGRLAALAATPISDVRASHDYRRAMAAVVVRRAVTGAVARARGETIPIPASASLFGAR